MMSGGGSRKFGLLLRSGGLKVRLAQVDCVGEFKVRGVAESLVMTKDDLE